MTEELLGRIEALERIGLDETLPVSDRIAAIDELMMWGGRLATRKALSRNLFKTAGCIHLKDGECRTDAWESLVALLPREDRWRAGLLLPFDGLNIFEEELIWRRIRQPDEPTPNPGSGWFWLRHKVKCSMCGDAMAAGDLARFDEQGDIVCEGCGA